MSALLQVPARYLHVVFRRVRAHQLSHLLHRSECCYDSKLHSVISQVFTETDKFVSIWITTPCWWLLVTAEDLKPKFLFMFKKTKPSIFRVSKVIGQLTDWQFSHVYDNRSRYTQTKDQRCDKHTKPRFDSTGLTGGEKQPMIWRKPRHVTNMVEPVLQCRWIITQKTST